MATGMTNTEKANVIAQVAGIEVAHAPSTNKLIYSGIRDGEGFVKYFHPWQDMNQLFDVIERLPKNLKVMLAIIGALWGYFEGRTALLKDALFEAVFQYCNQVKK